MKKLIGLLAATGLIAGAGATAVSCGCGSKKDEKKELEALKDVNIYLNDNDSKDLTKVTNAVKENLKNSKNENIKKATVVSGLPEKSSNDNEYLVVVALVKDKPQASLDLYHADKKDSKFIKKGNQIIETRASNKNQFDLNKIVERDLEISLKNENAKFKDLKVSIKNKIIEKSGINSNDVENYYSIDPSRKDEDDVKNSETFKVTSKKDNNNNMFLKNSCTFKAIVISENPPKDEDKAIELASLFDAEPQQPVKILKADENEHQKIFDAILNAYPKAKNKNLVLNTDVTMELNKTPNPKIATIKAKDTKKYKGNVDIKYTVVTQ